MVITKVNFVVLYLVVNQLNFTRREFESLEV